MARQSFSAQVDSWVRETKKRQVAVHRTACQDLANEVRVTKPQGGKMPIVTGNLRRSLMASTSDMPQFREDKKSFPENDGQITLTIAGAKPGETLYLGFQAAYAARREYGFQGTDSLGRTYNESGDAFVRSAAQRWQEIVTEATAKIRARVGG